MSTVLNKWKIFKVLFALNKKDQFTWTVEAAEHIGDIYLRTMIAEIDIHEALKRMGSLTNTYFHIESEIHIRKQKKEISVVRASSLQPLIVLKRDTGT